MNVNRTVNVNRTSHHAFNHTLRSRQSCRMVVVMVVVAVQNGGVDDDRKQVLGHSLFHSLCWRVHVVPRRTCARVHAKINVNT